MTAARLSPELPTAFVPRMGAISNRTLIEKMKDWGFEHVSKSGDWTSFKGPFNDTIVRVRSPHYHKGNPPQVILEVLAALNDMPWEVFIQYDLKQAELLMNQYEVELIQDALAAQFREAEERRQAQERAEQQDRERQQARAEKEARRKRAREEREQLVATPAAEPAESVRRPRVRAEGSNRGALTDAVFEAVASAQGPITVFRIWEPLQDRWTRQQVQGVCARLATTGVFTRVKGGTYRLSPDHQHHVIHPGDVERPVPGLSALEPREQAPARVSTPAPPVGPFTGAEDDTVLELLDLLCPSGFKAQHIPLIEVWKEATLRLLREVQR